MELVTSHKSMYLLEAGLEVLHEQSNEWLNEIAFWKDEVAFLYTLVVKKTLKSVPISAKNSIIKIEQELTKITGGELDELRQAVEQHEKYLSHLLEDKHIDEVYYRDKHRQLTYTIDQFHDRYKLLKKEIFGLVELINKSNPG